MKAIIMRNEADFKANGFDNIALIDDKYLETVVNGRKVTRVYYMNTRARVGSGSFYINDVRYEIPEIKVTLGEAEVSPLSKVRTGDDVVLCSFSGMWIGDFKVSSTTANTVSIINAQGTEMKFSKENGVQVIADGSKKQYASILVTPENAPDKDVKKKKRVREIDFNAPVKKKTEPKSEYDPKVKPKHPEYNTIKTCVEQDIPVYLVGEAGTGKNHTLQEIAEELGMDFYFTNSIQQEYKVTGFIDAGGVYHETEFYKAFRNGGVFFLDEMDASIPEVLVLLNAAIANKYFEFPNGKLNAHPDFRVVAAGNTVGSGANELYTGRLVLDSATLDRFVVIGFDYDRDIEISLAKGNTDLVNFVRSLRDFCRTNGIRGTFSYRMIISVTKLESAGLELTDIIKIAVVKGLDKDTINTLQVNNSGKYYHALKEVQGL